MIIQCQRCKKRYLLDDSRVRGGGVKVKCTQCQNIFVVKPPLPYDVETSDRDIMGQKPSFERPPKEVLGKGEEGKFPEMEEPGEKEGLQEEGERGEFEMGGGETPLSEDEGFGIGIGEYGPALEDKKEEEEKGIKLTEPESKGEREGLQEEGERGEFEMGGEETPLSEDEGFGIGIGEYGPALEDKKEEEEVLTEEGLEEVKKEAITEESAEEKEEEIPYNESQLVGKPKRRHRVKHLLILLALAVILSGGVFYAASNFESLSSNIGWVKDIIGIEQRVPVRKPMEIGELKGYPVTNPLIGKLYVIEGRLTSLSERSELIKGIKGSLFNKDGEEIYSKVVSPGRLVSKEDIKSLSREELDNRFKGTNEARIPPKGSVPFMIVFYRDVSALTEFSVEVLR